MVPCCNQGKYLAESLHSVLNQTYEEWECIIINDGSTDNTEKIALNWCQKDSRFKYLLQDNSGLSSARNNAISVAQGEFILPLDADDKIANNYIWYGIEAFEKDLELKVVYCKAEKFGEEKGLWDLKPFSLQLLAVENMIFCSAIFKKKDIMEIGGYDENMTYGWEDWDLWISLLKNGGKVKCLNFIGFYYRVKQNSMIKSLNPEKTKILHEYVGVKHADFFIREFGSFHYLMKSAEKVDFENQKLKIEKQQMENQIWFKIFKKLRIL